MVVDRAVANWLRGKVVLRICPSSAIDRLTDRLPGHARRRPEGVRFHSRLKIRRGRVVRQAYSGQGGNQLQIHPVYLRSPNPLEAASHMLARARQ